VPGSRRAKTLVARTMSRRCASERLAEDLLGLAERVDVGGVEQVYARFDTDLNQAPRLLHLHVAHGGEASFTAQRHGAEAQHRNFQTARA
jgi:hypothetical protein